ncbi:hypothetical protein HBH56_049800 [Parastagonospora nodorum]|nr:hypothetical protein HBH56_049800 [Parastagonospora nodorum]KAH3935976.1 hypothetical protein HBH54_035590 [Parastagonospora nodorum]KAH3988997.1 hypothetical protein HBH52_024760 [Parastagonospora nodorum]KAH4107835.1 hypothetical protein HBH46_054610 [Parastagonospora nodorum]KAH4140252.1 hypothetical protein HBH45_087460 [Parastagonospora nodorum]
MVVQFYGEKTGNMEHEVVATILRFCYVGQYVRKGLEENDKVALLWWYIVLVLIIVAAVAHISASSFCLVVYRILVIGIYNDGTYSFACRRWASRCRSRQLCRRCRGSSSKLWPIGHLS